MTFPSCQATLRYGDYSWQTGGRCLTIYNHPGGWPPVIFSSLGLGKKEGRRFCCCSLQRHIRGGCCRFGRCRQYEHRRPNALGRRSPIYRWLAKRCYGAGALNNISIQRLSWQKQRYQELFRLMFCNTPPALRSKIVFLALY